MVRAYGRGCSCFQEVETYLLRKVAIDALTRTFRRQGRYLDLCVELFVSLVWK